MNVTELRSQIGSFGILVAGENGYEKTLPGRLKDMDTRGSIWFVDNDGFGYTYKVSKIKSFTVKEFKPANKK